jgi:hypothetical protein
MNFSPLFLISLFIRVLYMDVQGVFLSTTSSMDVQGISLSTGSNMGMQGVSLSTASSMFFQGASHGLIKT